MSHLTSLPPTPDLDVLQVPLPVLEYADEFPDLREISLAGRSAAVEGGETDAVRWLGRATLCRDRCRLEEALSHANQAFLAAFQEQDVDTACRALGVQASALQLGGDFSGATQVIRRLRLFTERSGDGSLVALCDETEAMLHIRTVVQDWFIDARDLFRRALRQYQLTGDVEGQIRTTAGLASALSGFGSYVDVLELIDVTLRLASEHRVWRYTGRLLLEAALALRDQGYRHNVEALFELSEKWAEFVGDEITRIRAIHGVAFLFDFEADTSDPSNYQKSEAKFKRAIDEAEPLELWPQLIQTRVDLIHLYQKFNRLDDVERQRTKANQETNRLSVRNAPRWIEFQEDYREFVERQRYDRYLARVREGMEGITDPFLIFDPIVREDGTCADLINEFRNSAATRLLQLDRSAVRTMADLVRTPFFEGLRKPLLNAANGRETYEDEIATTNSQGETVWWARRVVPAGDGAVVTLRDATDAHKIEEALLVAAESAQGADRAKSEFLANMSHEVRTPINGVLGLARLLADSDLSPDQRTYVEGIISSGDILLRVIGDVLDVSKIEAHSMEVEIRPAHPQKIVDDVVRLHRGQATERGLELYARVDANVPAVANLDRTRVRQVLGNLVGNAVKFTQKGFVRIGLRSEADSLIFEVQDTGPGIPAEGLDQIFRPFQQWNYEASNEGGTGLGLTISKRLTELMGGEISVESEIDTGSRFTFRVPVTVGEEELEDPTPDTSSESESNTNFEGCHILLVEDNPVNTLVARVLLQKLGCEVVTATNGAEAVSRVAEQSFDLVLMDVRMPVMDGLTATREIRAREAQSDRRVPIVALTAGALVNERNECFEAGMDGYLAKPFTVEALRSTLRRFSGPKTASI